VGFAEKLAVTEHAAPLAVKLEKLYDKGEVKGALNVCVPPQDPVIVNVPVVGGLVKLICPVKLYKFPEQPAGVDVIDVIEHGVTQLAGAV